MIIIGEKINSSIPSSEEAIRSRDAQALILLAKAQREAGADFIDINAGTFLEEEPAALAWLAKTLDESLHLPLSIDTPRVAAAEAALAALDGGGHLINSVTLQPERLEPMASLAAEHGCGVIALCLNEDGRPGKTEERIAAASKLAEYLTKKGLRPGDIYLDPMLRPIAADECGGTEALDTIRRLRAALPECHISVGLSNLSYGLPKRKLINRAFAVAAAAAGLDAAIADPLDRELMGLLAALEAVLGKDEYGLDYIDKCRGGVIG